MQKIKGDKNMNPIEYLESKGFIVTSDPAKYASGIWGKRDYTVNGYNYDNYCGGYHRAWDLVKSHLANIPAVFDGEVVAGTSAWGNFGGTVVVANKELGIQVIYGHLDRNIPVKIGQKIKQGQTIGKQSHTNYQGVYMASHLHIQFQYIGYRPEREFVCNGINILNINVNNKKASKPSSKDVLSYTTAWDYSGTLTLTADVNYLIYPHTRAPKQDVIKKGTKLSFNRLYNSDVHWWIRATYKGGIWFLALGKRKDGEIFVDEVKKGNLWINKNAKIKKGKKVTGSKNTYDLGTVHVPITEETASIANVFDKYTPRANRAGAYFKGVIKSTNGLGAGVRKWSNYKLSHQPDLVDGSVVYVFEVSKYGWGRIFSQTNDGMVHLDQVQVTEVF